MAPVLWLPPLGFGLVAPVFGLPSYGSRLVALVFGIPSYGSRLVALALWPGAFFLQFPFCGNKLFVAVGPEQKLIVTKNLWQQDNCM